MVSEDIKILIVDDSILARKQLKDVLLSTGITHIIEATNGQEAVDLYRKDRPDLVFLDIVMPIKDGNHAIVEIKEMDPTALIIIVSSVGTQTELRKMIEAGAKDFVQKPFARNQIVELLNHCFEGR